MKTTHTAPIAITALFFSVWLNICLWQGLLTTERQLTCEAEKIAFMDTITRVE